MENNKEQETIEKLKDGLWMLNTLLKDCRDQNISVHLEAVNSKGTYITEMYFHADNDNTIELKEAYKIEKFK